MSKEIEVVRFWDLSRVEPFILSVMEHYKHGPKWFIDWLDDLSVRLEDHQEWKKITLDELHSLASLLSEEGWEHEIYACNKIYKMLHRLERDTTGIIGY